MPAVEESDTLGKATNNVAEYTALIRALEVAADLGVRDLSVFSDSELMVKQMAGEYRVKNADLQELHREAQALRKGFDSVTLTHVRRAQNADADKLCNEALDGRPRRGGKNPSPGPSPGRRGETEPESTPLPAPSSLPGKGARESGSEGNPSPTPSRSGEGLRSPAPPLRLGEGVGGRGSAPAPDALEEEAVALLNAVATSWAAHGAGNPSAVDVWDRLWTLLGEHDVLKYRK